jgi:tetrahydromethanopterin S-methyltransferase subunit H
MIELELRNVDCGGRKTGGEPGEKPIFVARERTNKQLNSHEVQIVNCEIGNW